MRVAYLLTPISKPNGWRSHARGFLNAISRYVEPILFVASEDDQAAEELFPGIRRYRLPAIQYPFASRPQYAKLAASLAAIVRGTYPQVDLVHSLEAYPAGLAGHWLAAKLKRPHLLTIHGTYGILPYGSRAHRALYRRVLRRAAALCPVSPQTGDLLREYFPKETAGARVRPILNGNDFYKAVPRLEATSRPIPEIPTILSVGAVKPRKGYHLSLEAFARLKQELPEARYWIVGSVDQPKYLRRLQEYIAAERLEDVKLMGTVSTDQLHECYRQASVFLLTPQQVKLYFEGFGLVYLEAGAFGLPAVGVRSGGVPSAIRHGETGFVVEADPIDGLVEALRRLLTDPDLARRMGLANREWAETLTWERNAKEQYAVYREILNC